MLQVYKDLAILVMSLLIISNKVRFLFFLIILAENFDIDISKIIGLVSNIEKDYAFSKINDQLAKRRQTHLNE